jgi:hypothetical protein
MDLFRRKKKNGAKKEDQGGLGVDQMGGGRASKFERGDGWEAAGLSMGIGFNQSKDTFGRVSPSQAQAMDNFLDMDEVGGGRASSTDDAWEESGISNGMGLRKEYMPFEMTHPALQRDEKQARIVKEGERSSVMSIGMGVRSTSTIEFSHPALQRDAMQGQIVDASVSASGTSFPIWEKSPPPANETVGDRTVSIGLGNNEQMNPMIAGNPLLQHRASKGSGGLPIPVLLQRCTTKPKNKPAEEEPKEEDVVDDVPVGDVLTDVPSRPRVSTHHQEQKIEQTVACTTIEKERVRGAAAAFFEGNRSTEERLHGGLGLLAFSCGVVALALLVIEGLLGYCR